MPTLRNSGMPFDERRQISVLFCDMVDSTMHASKMDLEDYRELLGAYQQVCRGCIARHEGYFARVVGDGIVAYFGVPVVREDDAFRAVATALDVLPTVETITGSNGRPLQVRIGIATGEVIVGQHGGDSQRDETIATGSMLHLASRLQEFAEPRQICVDDRTRRLVERLYRFETRGFHPLKGFATPIEVYRVVGEHAGYRRDDPRSRAPSSVFVAREKELATLHAVAARARNGEAAAIVLKGEPGIGKSSLAEHFVGELGPDIASFVKLECISLYRSSFLAPLTRFLSAEIGIIPRDDVSEHHRMVGEWCRTNGLDTNHRHAIAGLLLGADGTDCPVRDPEQRRMLIVDAVIRVVIGPARGRLSILLIDDVQWADPSTLAFLGTLRERPDTRHLLVMMTAREVPQALLDALDPQVLVLLELDEVATRALIRCEMGGNDNNLPAEVVAHVAKVSQGVPLVTRELLHDLLESGSLEWTAGGYQLKRPLSQLQVPSTLRATLEARLDRLGDLKPAAQMAACIGDSFDGSLLARVLGASSVAEDAAGASLLQALVDTDLLRPGSTGGDKSFRFRHSLLQEVAYGSLVREQRRRIHAQIAETLEQYSASSEDEITAHHHERAGNAKRAVEHYFRAVERFSANSAHHEALAILGRIEGLLDQIPTDGERERLRHRFINDKGVLYFSLYGYGAPEARTMFDVATILEHAHADREQLFRTHWGLARLHTVNGRLQDGLRAAQRAFEIATETGQREQLIEAHLALGVARLWLGHFPDSLDDYHKVEEYYEPADHGYLLGRYGEDPETLFSTRMAFPLWMLGHPDQALARCENGIAAAERLGHQMSRIRAYAFTAWIHQFRGEVDETGRHGAKVIDLACEAGSRFWTLCGEMQVAWSAAQQADPQEGIDRFRRALVQTERTGTVGRTYHRALLAELCLEGQDAAGAWRALREAEHAAVRSGDGFCKAELHRLRGTIGIHAGLSRAEALCELEAAARTAREQRARSLELRSVCAMLSADPENRQRRHRAVAELLAGMDEGHATRDVQRATALLANVG